MSWKPDGLGPVIDVICFVTGDPFLIRGLLRKVVLLVPVGGALRETARDLVERRWLLAHVVEVHAEFGIRLPEMAFETSRVHVSNFYAGVPLIKSISGALDSFTLTMVVKCVRCSSDFHIVS